MHIAWPPDNWPPGNWPPGNWPPGNWPPDNWPPYIGSQVYGSSWLIQYYAVLSSDQDVRNVDSFDNLLNMLFKFARVGEFG